MAIAYLMYSLFICILPFLNTNITIIIPKIVVIVAVGMILPKYKFVFKINFIVIIDTTTDIKLGKIINAVLLLYLYCIIR